MEANYINQSMDKDKLEQLKALTRLMMVSILWHGAGLMEPKEETKQDATKEAITDSETDKYPDTK